MEFCEWAGTEELLLALAEKRNGTTTGVLAKLGITDLGATCDKISACLELK